MSRARRRPTRTFVTLLGATSAIVGGIPLGLAVNADSSVAGSLSGVISQGANPACFTAQYQPPADKPCPPAAMAMSVLPTGKVLFWDGLEGMNKVQYNVVAEFGDVAADDQSRVITIPAGSVPTQSDFATPGNQRADLNADGKPVSDQPDPLLPGGAGVVNSPGNDYDLFCSPLVQLANGELLSAGGTAYYLEPGVTDPTTGKSYGVSELQGLKATRLFQPITDKDDPNYPGKWITQPASSNLNVGRWYPTLVTLPTGKVFIASGVTKLIKPVYPNAANPFDSGRNVTQTETFDPGTSKWTLNHSSVAAANPTLPDASQQSLPLFARLHMLPDGKVYFDAAGQTFNPDGQAYDEATWVNAKIYDPATEAWSDLAADSPTGLPLVDGLPVGFRGSGFDVMLPLVPNKNGDYNSATVFNGGGVVGVTPGSYVGDNSTTLNTITTTGGTDTLSSKNGPTLLNRRWYGSAVALPDGEVFVTNGASGDEVDGPGSAMPVQQTELIDPTAGTVTAGPNLDKDHGRTYHNTAILLPDGRVLIGGHAPIATGYASQNDSLHQLGFSSAESDSTFQIYSPPYISGYGTRPTIDSADRQVANGATLDIQTHDAGTIDKVVLVRNPSLTHLTDGDQRTVELTFTHSGDEVFANVPSSKVVPPGPYMVFVERLQNGHLVPSVSQQVFVGAQAPPYLNGDGGSSGTGPTLKAHAAKSQGAKHANAHANGHPKSSSSSRSIATAPVALVGRHDGEDWAVLAFGAGLAFATGLTRRRMLRRR